MWTVHSFLIWKYNLITVKFPLFSIESYEFWFFFFHFFFFYFLKYLFIYLATPGLNCSMWDLQSSLQHTGFFSCSMWDLVP